MDCIIETAEIAAKRELLQDYPPGQSALEALTKHDGNIENAFEELWIEKNGQVVMAEGQSFWKLTLKVLRDDLCGNEGFRNTVKEYNKNPGSAPLLTGAIVSVVTLAAAHGVPLDPAIATIIVLYVLKIGLNIFCEYTETPADSTKNLPPSQ